MPFRVGGAPGGASRAQRLLESMQSARGSAYSTATNSAVYVENVGLARLIDRDMYGANERLAAQFTSTGMTAQGLLSRWEVILGLTPSPTDTDGVRRARVAQKFLSIGLGNAHQQIVDGLKQLLGAVFVQVDLYVVGGNAVQYWPGGNTQFPAGSNGIALAAPAWTTTSAVVSVKVVNPGNYSQAQFLAAVGLIGPFLDAALPAWATWNWYTVSSDGTKDFLLDDANNLRNEVLGS